MSQGKITDVCLIYFIRFFLAYNPVTDNSYATVCGRCSQHLEGRSKSEGPSHDKINIETIVLILHSRLNPEKVACNVQEMSVQSNLSHKAVETNKISP